MIAMYWTHAAQTNSQPWIDRVSSKANLSDGVSRDDWELADQMGRARLDLDMTPAYAVFQQVANDSNYAYTAASQQLQSVMKDQIMEELNKIPWSKDLRFRTSPACGQRTRGAETLSASSGACGRGVTLTPP